MNLNLMGWCVPQPLPAQDAWPVMVQRYHRLSERTSRPFPEARDHSEPPSLPQPLRDNVRDSPGLMHPEPREASSHGQVGGMVPPAWHTFSLVKMQATQMHLLVNARPWWRNSHLGGSKLTGSRAGDGTGNVIAGDAWSSRGVDCQVEGRARMKTRKQAGAGSAGGSG